MSYYSDAVTLKRLSRLSRYVITSVCVAIGSLGVAVVALVVALRPATRLEAVQSGSTPTASRTVIPGAVTHRPTDP